MRTCADDTLDGRHVKREDTETSDAPDEHESIL